MRQAGVSDDVVGLFGELLAVVFDGRSSEVMRGVEETLGQPGATLPDAWVAAMFMPTIFPRRPPRWHALGRGAGFGQVRELFAQTNLFRVYCFRV
jgi:hypothetical protein